MKIALVLLMFTQHENPQVEVIHGFKDLLTCQIAGKQVTSIRDTNNDYYKCIIIDNNNIVEKQP